MANEILMSSQLSVRKGNLNDRRSKSFGATLSGSRGGAPGLLRATTAGTTVDLSSLESIGIAWLENIDPTYDVMFGVYDPDTTVFYPVLQLKPGEGFPVRLSPYLGEQLSAGTGTATANNTVQVRGV